MTAWETRLVTGSMNFARKIMSNPSHWDRKTIASLISEVEDYPEKAPEIMNAVLRHTGKAHVIGITGPPGSGKSVLIEKLALRIRKMDKTVGIIATDPTSHYSGGAFMGNRVRMREASKDTGVFIRSMASRGSQSGLSRATLDTVKILDAAGTDYVIIETVGAGQIQTEIARTAYTVVVVLQPQIGDIVQALKAGMMEIGDIFVVNKSDLPGTDKTLSDLTEIVSIGHPAGWKPRVVRTVATKGSGIGNLARYIDEHMEYLVSTGELLKRKEEIAENEIEKILEERSKQAIRQKLHHVEAQKAIKEVAAGKISAYDAVSELSAKAWKSREC